MFNVCFMPYLVSFCSCVFRPFSIAITSLGEVRANLSAFRMFNRFVLVGICRFLLPRYLGRAAICDCGTPRTFLVPFFYTLIMLSSTPSIAKSFSAEAITSLHSLKSI